MRAFVFRDWLKRAAGLFAAALLCSCSVISDLSVRPLPQHRGRIHVAGLHQEVEILRDAWGVPHLYAQDEHDVFFAQGYTQAQDRWWQMELYRHIGAGRLSELIGEAGIGNDVYIRTVHLYDTAAKEVDRLEPGARAMLDAFVEGVNAYILTRSSGELAMEYEALGLVGVNVDIYPWSAADSLVFAKIIQLQQCAPMEGEATYEDVLKKIGAERMQYWTPPIPYDLKPTIIQAEDLPGSKSAQMRDWVQALMRPAIGSNSWIVNASLSKTGRPILENDPHLSVSVPSIYYEIALHGADSGMDVAGVSFPLLPGILIGHNASVAWGVTIGKGVDQWDTYHVKVNPERPLEQYEWNGQWADFVTRNEVIHIAEEADITISVRETVHGPIIDDMLVNDTDGYHTEQRADPFALSWTSLDPGGVANAVYRLAKANDWDAFHEALRFWDAPACNFSYADVSGNIGYQLAAKAPLRAKDDSGLIPASGWSDAYLWKGFVPYDDMPHVLNPARGFIVHANQSAEPPAYYEWLAEQLGSDVNVQFQPTAFYGYRAERIEQLLEGKAPYSVEDFAAMESDVKLTSVDEAMPYLQALSLKDVSLVEVRDWLVAWDRRFSEDSPQATLYALFWTHLLRNIYRDEVSAPEPNDAAMYAVKLLLEDPGNAWWDDVGTTIIEDRDAILERSLRDAELEAASRFGSDRSDWAWGKVHTITFVNMPIGSSGIGLAEWLVNRGPFPFPGALETVNLGEWNHNTTSFAVEWAPCLRVIFDVGDWDNSLIALAPGQSGHPVSRNYADQIDLWRKVQHRKMLWSREQVLDKTRKRLLLIPKE